MTAPDEPNQVYMTLDVFIDNLELPVDQCTATEQSCKKSFEMPTLTTEQKRFLKSLYKNGEKVVTSELNANFISECLNANCVPKCFKVKNNLPGNKAKNQEKLNKVIIESMKDEKIRHLNMLKGAKTEFDKKKKQIGNIFAVEVVNIELERLNIHLQNVHKARSKIHETN